MGRTAAHRAYSTVAGRASWVVLTAAAFLAGCGDDAVAPPKEPEVERVELDRVAVELELGDSTRLEATVRDTDGGVLVMEPVVWTSSAPQVVEVTTNGWIRGLSEGSARITASAGGRAASADVVVLGWNIAENAVVIDSTRLSLVSDSLERAGGLYRFEVLEAPAPEIDVGDVIVGAQHLGFLRRVTEVAVSGDVVTLLTEQAALSEIVEAGSFDTTIELDFTAPAEVAPVGLPGAREVVWGTTQVTRLVQGATVGPAGVDLSGIDICKLLAAGGSGGGTTCPSAIKKLQVKTGVLDFTPDLDVEADFDGFSLESFRGVAQGSIEADFDVLLEAETSATLFPQIDIIEITRPFYGQIGPVPVLGYAELKLTGGLEVKATAKGSIEAGFTNSHTIDVGAEWSKGMGWTPVFDSQRQFEALEPSLSEGTLKGQIDLVVKLSVKPEIKIIFYGVVGPFLNVEPYGKATLTFGTMSCGFSSEAGINSEIGFTIPFLDPSVANLSNKKSPWFQWPGRTWTCPLGTLDVHTITNGPDADDDGYTLAIDDGDRGVIGPTDDRTIDFVEVGSRKVRLDGVASNCTVQGDNPQTVSVVTGGIQAVNFQIDCTAVGGDLEVSVNTSGDNLDLDGYTVTLDGGASQSIATQGQTAFANVQAGMHEVALSDLASNCSVQGDNPVSVEVIAGMPASVTFDVNCTVARLDVTTSTTGTPLMTDWTVALSDGQSRSIGPNDLVSFEPDPGHYAVELQDAASNCTVQGQNPRDVDVTESGVVSVAFQITCQGSSLTVNVTTDGDASPTTSYTVRANFTETMPVGLDGSVVFGNLPQGPVPVGLEGVPAQCVVLGDNPRNVTVPGQTTFEVVCQQPVMCGTPPGTADLSTDTYVDEPEGTSVSVTVLENDWGKVSVTSSASGPGGAEGGVSSTALDNLFLQPVDPGRVGETVFLRVHVRGHFEVTGSPSDLTLLRGDISGSRGGVDFSVDPPDPVTALDVDEIVQLEYDLGEWGQLFLYVEADSLPEGGGSVTSSSQLTIADFVDVRDADDQVVPIVGICSESGTVY